MPGKLLLTTAVAQWVAEKGGGLDVCSGGELATALIAGVDPNQIVMQGSAPTPGELCKAANAGGRTNRRGQPRQRSLFRPPMCVGNPFKSELG
jgi:Pyridoxal-dependent decarboxylase, pyridoxal binding domain